MPAKHYLDLEGLQLFKASLYSDLKTINNGAITGGGNLSLVVSNAAITGATKCKITYDSKGLVTAGADLTASDIPSLAISKITNLQSSLDSKADKVTVTAQSTSSIMRITHNAQGLITESVPIDIATNTDIDNLFN